ncbi:hypothetical protein S58_70580 [Bradyrhizobium oligotrophicum S58]|uniref:Uncharacterized protein n=1 Tax=Bradyrhizobium oligotrophicum S58 TaxID=1245469 RepID=M4ZGU9_9BRAD|nr:hypothetical protein S58_70580 [Bradyrhizobium oligotrophicum S58]
MAPARRAHAFTIDRLAAGDAQGGESNVERELGNMRETAMQRAGNCTNSSGADWSKPDTHVLKLPP